MDKSLKISVSIAILIITISIAYYLFVHLPASKALTDNIKCQEIGMVLYNQDKKSGDDLISYFEPEFKFIKSLNTCLYKGGFIDNSTYVYKFIKDVYTNKEIASYSQLNFETTVFGEKENYNNVALKYFGSI